MKGTLLFAALGARASVTGGDCGGGLDRTAALLVANLVLSALKGGVSTEVTR